jgi:hypothetical protein
MGAEQSSRDVNNFSSLTEIRSFEVDAAAPLGLAALEQSRVVTKFYPDSAAFKSGLRVGDRIMTIDGAVMASLADCRAAIDSLRKKGRGNIIVGYASSFKLPADAPSAVPIILLKAAAGTKSESPNGGLGAPSASTMPTNDKLTPATFKAPVARVADTSVRVAGGPGGAGAISRRGLPPKTSSARNLAMSKPQGKALVVGTKI